MGMSVSGTVNPFFSASPLNLIRWQVFPGEAVILEANLLAKLAKLLGQLAVKAGIVDDRPDTGTE